MSRNLEGRCGSCGWYTPKVQKDDGSWQGDCRLNMLRWPVADTAACSSHKSKAVSWSEALKRKAVAGSPKRYREATAAAPRPSIPNDIGINMDQEEFRTVLREVLLDELGVRDTAMSDRWDGGELVLKPSKEGTQEKSIPLDVFFKKIVMVRDKLRVLESKVNGNSSLSQQEKVQLQQYITGCYGSLTSFNVLFKSKEDQFRGQGGK